MKLHKIEDPRDPLEKVRRKPLENFCIENKIPGAERGMPARLMRQLIRAAGHTMIPAKTYPLGGRPATEAPVQSSTPDEALLKDWKRSQGKTEDDYSKMPMKDVRNACREKGIRWFPKDTKNKLIDKLTQQEPVHEDVS